MVVVTVEYSSFFVVLEVQMAVKAVMLPLVKGVALQPLKVEPLWVNGTLEELETVEEVGTIGELGTTDELGTV